MGRVKESVSAGVCSLLVTTLLKLCLFARMHQEVNIM